MNRSTSRYALLSQASFLLVYLLLLFSSALAGQQANLVGIWQWAEGNASLTLQLNGDGTGALNNDRFDYVVRGSQLIVKDGNGEVNSYSFKLDGNALAVSGGSLPRTLTFTRQAGSSGSGGLFEKNVSAAPGRDAGTAETTTPPVGMWERREGQRTVRLVLNLDGTGTLDGGPFRWTLARGVLNLTEGNSTLRFNTSFDSKALTLTKPEGGRALVFNRVGGGADSSAKSSRGASVGLIGLWRSSAATVHIFDDGTLTINDERFRYSVQDNIIILTSGEGTFRVQFQLNGDTLVTNFNGERSVYTRAAEGELTGPRGGGGDGSHPQELIGKWCYMANVNNSSGGRMSNACFTLYENGTYDYYSETSTSTQYGGSASQNSDGGTWSVAGGTLIANSRKNGRLTFSLEKRNHPKTGDPMLVLDGDAFVTYSPRQPWP